MDRLAIVAPALIPAAYMILMFVVYVVRWAIGRPPEVDAFDRRRASEVFGPFLTHYFYWILQPVLRLGVAWRISANTLTFASLVCAAAAGVAIATNHLATAGWLYILAGAFDVLDGRLARATSTQTRAGAFLDSVADRWAELFVLSGFVWFLRDSPWMAAALFAIVGSMMVSYTRARGEGVGLKLDRGAMQRAERIALVAIGTLIAAWIEVGTQEVQYGVHVIGAALLVTGVGSTLTALGRWREGYQRLAHRDALEAAAREQRERDGGERGDHTSLRAC
jgi:phosphatidylglycerophosphate synthase